MKSHKPNRPCEFFDHQTLEYYIKTDRDCLAEAAMEEWFFRWKTNYPMKGGQNEITTKKGSRGNP